MFKFVRIHLELAQYAVSRSDDDDRFLLPAAYHVEQAIEKTLKQVANELGIQFAGSPTITRLLAAIPEDSTIVSVESLEFLEVYASMLREWEASLKYNADCVATRRTVVKILKFAENFYSEVASNIKLQGGVT